MYRTMNVEIHKEDALYPWCENIARLSNNLYNAVLFRERQMMTAVKKNPSEWSDHEKEIVEEVNSVLPLMKEGRKVSESGYMNYYFLTEYLQKTQNPDYRAHIPRHTANGVLKHADRDFKSFFEANKSYKNDPSRFTGRPQFPRYRKKGGMCSFDVSNQECVIKQNDKGRYYAKLPHTKERVYLGKEIHGRLKEVHVTPMNQVFRFSFVFEDETSVPELPEKSERMIGIDMGVSNLMAVVNNCGLPGMLYKGGVTKSVNHYYNRKIAAIESAQTKGTTKKFTPTANCMKATQKRNNQMRDYMQKTSKHLIGWCVENRIDTIVIGENRGWKQEVQMSRESNQKFVQIPYELLKRCIEYRAEREGIRVIRQEESYTSKASYVDGDEIPVYGNEGGKPEFSGVRDQRLYKTKAGLIVNSDLNGAANILRKNKADAFKDYEPDFNRIRVIHHPDKEIRNAIPDRG